LTTKAGLCHQYFIGGPAKLFGRPVLEGKEQLSLERARSISLTLKLADRKARRTERTAVAKKPTGLFSDPESSLPPHTDDPDYEMEWRPLEDANACLEREKTPGLR